MSREASRLPAWCLALRLGLPPAQRVRTSQARRATEGQSGAGSEIRQTDKGCRMPFAGCQRGAHPQRPNPRVWRARLHRVAAHDEPAQRFLLLRGGDCSHARGEPDRAWPVAGLKSPTTPTAPDLLSSDCVAAPLITGQAGAKLAEASAPHRLPTVVSPDRTVHLSSTNLVRFRHSRHCRISAAGCLFP